MSSAYTDLLLPTLQELLKDRPQTSQEVRRAVLAGCVGPLEKGTNWVAHCLVKLQEALLIRKAGEGMYDITERGRKLLATGVATISLRTLEQYPEYVDAQRTRGIRAAESRADGIGS
jgi:restriction endonuclease Mrr